jgi:hypothetical protein
MLVEVVVYETGKRALRIVAAASVNPGDWAIRWIRSWIREIDKIALAWDCETVEFSGRRGWARLFARDGYIESGVVLEKGIR